ncbi:hypothetical protein NDU88_004159 [Pleurodeles waltl]|uniref:Uncharacterized protein n=1 Tax=Pleurodeles waltl TaxID=8319 RepID=A0AAV7LHQ6_PLEWA|nr:hypothetical protein NDU88_004159 [Pleurodeles waltl]
MPFVGPDHGVFLGAAAVRGGPIQNGNPERVAPSLSVQFWLFGRVSILREASSRPGVSATFRGPSAHLCHHSRHQEVPLCKRPSAAPAPARRVSPGCSAASQLSSVLEPTYGRSATHTALSPPRCSSTAPACRGDHVWSAASAPSRVLSSPRHTSAPARPHREVSSVRPRLSRGNQPRLPFCFQGRIGRIGRGSGTGPLS